MFSISVTKVVRLRRTPEEEEKTNKLSAMKLSFLFRMLLMVSRAGNAIIVQMQMYNLGLHANIEVR